MNENMTLIQRFKGHPVVSVLLLCASAAAVAWGVATQILVVPRDFEIARLDRELNKVKAQSPQTATATPNEVTPLARLTAEANAARSLAEQRQQRIDGLTGELQTLRQELEDSRSKLEERQRRLEALNQRVSALEGTLAAAKAELAQGATASKSPSRPSEASLAKRAPQTVSQETSWFKASVRRLIVQANGDVVAFMEYSSKRSEDYHVGLSGCASDWRQKTYLVDDVGNTFHTRSASGIGYVDCDFINDPVLLTPGGNATFSIVFARSNAFEKRGTTYSLSSAQHVGRIGADGRWRNVTDLNISLMDISPTP